MADALSALECSGYTVTDPHFGAPYVDRDEWHDEPHGHRRVHGGFAECDTRFTFYFPRHDEWQGRLIMPLEGAHAGHEDFFGGSARRRNGRDRAHGPPRWVHGRVQHGSHR